MPLRPPFNSSPFPPEQHKSCEKAGSGKGVGGMGGTANAPALGIKEWGAFFRG
jgi:hypothetical protein